MNPLAAGILAYVLIGLELALRPALGLGDTGVAPSLVLPLVVFVAMSAQAPQALWMGLLTGMAVDLLTKFPRAAADPITVTLIGPNAIGFLAAAYVTLTLRGLMIRRNPLSLVALTLAGGALAALIAVALITLRAQFDSAMLWSPTRELLSRLGWAAYSSAVAFVLFYVLRALSGVLGLADTSSRRYAR